jgi:hypothetical protein
VSNKYYSIIGVLSHESEKAKEHNPKYVNPNKYRFSFKVPNKDEEYEFNITRSDDPYFVLQETESRDTVYTDFFNVGFILVGGVVKTQQTFIGKTFLRKDMNNYWRDWEEIDRLIEERNYNGNIDVERLINIINNSDKRRYKCIDVVIKEGDVNLVLQNTEDTAEQIVIKHDENFDKNYITESRYKEAAYAVYEFAEKKIAEKKRREEERAKQDAAYRQQLEQQKARRKQELTAKYGAATTAKILAGEYEIGMSKAACKEILGHEPSVSEKTATTETWQITVGFLTYKFLNFEGDKLVRISVF